MAQNSTTSVSVSPDPALQRRKSSQQRIQDILEGARERAETLSPRLQPLLGGDGPRGPSYLAGLTSDPEEVGAGDDGGRGVVTAPPQRQSSISFEGSAQDGSTARRRPGPSKKPSSAQERGRSLAQGDSSNEDGSARRRSGAREEERWWRKSLRYFQSIELENKGSVARDHLALERTFLAWLRTSLAFASIGIAITQLFRLNTSLADDSRQAESLRHLGKPLGSTFLAISILILLLGYNRYLQSQHWVIRGKFPASRGTIMLVAFIAFAVTVASLIVVLAVQNESVK